MGADSQENRIQTGSVVQRFDCSQTLAAVCVRVCVYEGERKDCVFDMRLIRMLWKPVCAAEISLVLVFEAHKQVCVCVCICKDLLARVYNCPFIHTHARSCACPSL